MDITGRIKTKEGKTDAAHRNTGATFRFLFPLRNTPEPAPGSLEKAGIYVAERKAAFIRHRRACVKLAAKN